MKRILSLIALTTMTLFVVTGCRVGGEVGTHYQNAIGIAR